MKKITLTGSEGIIGMELSKYLSKKFKIIKLDLKLGHDLTDEKFVKNWFQKNQSDYLINCFAINDHISKKRENENLFDLPLENFSTYLDTNLVSLFSVCREFIKNHQKGGIINFSSYLGIVSPNPSLYNNTHKNIGYCVSKSGVIYLTIFAHLVSYQPKRMRSFLTRVSPSLPYSGF